MTITRRSALKSLAATVAAIMVPTVRLRPAIDREALLARFCLPSDVPSRWDLHAPFLHGRLAYATDARWMARAELPSVECDGERLLPRVEQAWKNAWNPTGAFRPFDLPPIDALTLGDLDGDWGSCPECDNRRVSFGDSYPTDQTAADELPDYDPDDNTIRDVSCPRCHGRPYLGPNRAMIGGVILDYTRLKTIAQVPNVEVAPAVHASITSHDCLLFRGDGFEGILMGMTKEGTRVVNR